MRIELNSLKKDSNDADQTYLRLEEELMVADYFRILTAEKRPMPKPSVPVTQSLRGLLKGAKIDETNFRRHLEEKHW